jgi:Cu/Ag efflux protein CusF
MRKTLAVLSVLSILGSAGAALAEEAMGKIQAVDPATRTLTLEDGSSFILGEAVAIDSLQPGSDVTVSFEEKDGQKTATEVKPAQ